MKDKVSEMKNSLVGLNSKLDTTEEKIRDLEHRTEENIQSDSWRHTKTKSEEERERDIEEVRRSNVLLESQVRRERKRVTNNIPRDNGHHFPRVAKDIKP